MRDVTVDLIPSANLTLSPGEALVAVSRSRLLRRVEVLCGEVAQVASGEGVVGVASPDEGEGAVAVGCVEVQQDDGFGLGAAGGCGDQADA